MPYRALILEENVVIRDADNNITDAEFYSGVRNLFADVFQSKYVLTQKVLDYGYDFLSEEEWNNMIYLSDNEKIDYYTKVSPKRHAIPIY